MMYNDYLNFIVPNNNPDEAITDAPSIYHEAVFYSIIGTILGRKRYFPFGDISIYTNLWLCVLGETSKFRKSTALAIGLRLLRDLKSSSIYPNEFSHEKLVEIMSQNPIGTFCFFELKALLDALEKDYLSSTRAFLTEMFDCPEYYRRQTNNKERGDIIIEKPAISILGASTISWLQMSETNLQGGFLTRFLFVNAIEKDFIKDIPAKANIVLRNKVLFNLRMINADTDQIEYGLSPDAEKLYKDQCRSIEARMDNPGNIRVAPLFARQNIYTIKIAMIIQTLMDVRCTEITEEAMSRAVFFVDKCVDNIARVLGDIPQNRDESAYRKVKNMIEKVGRDKGLSHSQALKHSHMDSRKFRDVIATLSEREDIVIEQISDPATGKEVKFYRIRGGKQ